MSSRCREGWFLLRLPIWLADGHVLPLSSHGQTSVHPRVCVQSSSYKDIVHVGLRLSLIASF